MNNFENDQGGEDQARLSIDEVRAQVEIHQRDDSSIDLDSLASLGTSRLHALRRSLSEIIETGGEDSFRIVRENGDLFKAIDTASRIAHEHEDEERREVSGLRPTEFAFQELFGLLPDIGPESPQWPIRQRLEAIRDLIVEVEAQPNVETRQARLRCERLLNLLAHPLADSILQSTVETIPELRAAHGIAAIIHDGSTAIGGSLVRALRGDFHPELGKPDFDTALLVTQGSSINPTTLNTAFDTALKRHGFRQDSKHNLAGSQRQFEVPPLDISDEEFDEWLANQCDKVNLLTFLCFRTQPTSFGEFQRARMFVSLTRLSNTHPDAFVELVNALHEWWEDKFRQPFKDKHVFGEGQPISADDRRRWAWANQQIGKGFLLICDSLLFSTDQMRNRALRVHLQAEWEERAAAFRNVWARFGNLIG